jgi:hypothetical protein
MKMPKRCGTCNCRRIEFDIDHVGVFCSLKDNEYVEDPDSRPSWCPIICQLPEGHGRLVDADKFIAHLFAKWQDGYISNSEWCDIRQRVNEETTIVPAERSEL